MRLRGVSGPKLLLSPMINRIHPSIVLLVACLAVGGCSRAATSERASLLSTGSASSLEQGGSLSGTIRYWSPSTRHHSEPARSYSPLPRFAAMPRFKPHAPHVRQSETACLNGGYVQTTQFIRPRSPIGNGDCHLVQPFVVQAAAGGRITLAPAATMRCQMIPSFETWITRVLTPAARRYLGSDVVRMRIAASYSCRTRNSIRGAKLSEHGRGNALDISEFQLANGRVVTVKRGWRGREDSRRFLRYIHRGACEHFSTVLGPNADRYHHDHLHLDLASHGRHGNYRVCK